MTSFKKIGWIGTGVMGESMCKHLLKAGFELTIFTRTKAKAETLLTMGAKWADSPKEVAAQSEVVCVMVGFPSDVRSVILESPDSVLTGCKPGMIICDFTTSTPALAIEIASSAQKQGVQTLDCPVSGGDIGAREARLTIMCGGEKNTFDAMIPVFEKIGKSWSLMGPAGSGQHTKCVNQTVIASSMIGVCEGLLYAQKAHLDPMAVFSAISSGAASSFSLTSYWPRIVKGDYAPGFFVKHFVKDLGIVVTESTRMGLHLRGVELAKEMYEKLMKEVEGGAEMGTQALIKVLEIMSKE